MFDELYFADSVAYLTYIDNLYFYRTADWFLFEPLSKAFLAVVRDLAASTEATVAISHYWISLVYLLGTLIIFPPREGNWRGLLMAFALYGPQLAFVTIRATPAYFFAAAAVMVAMRGSKRSLVYALIAVCFHVSATLALLPIAVLFFKGRLRRLQSLQNPRILLTTLVVVGVIFVLIGPTIFSIAQQVFSNIPFLGKYLVFVIGLSEAGGVASTVSNFAIGHFVLLAAVSIFFFTFITIPDQYTRSVGVFVIVSYMLYLLVFLAFSPVAAFRQTPFWVLPAFSLFPWQKVGWRGIGHAPFLMLTAGIFAFQFDRVI